MAIYTSIEFSTGKIYEYSKTEKEGFEKYESSTGKVSYRRYYNKGLYGTYKGTEIRSTDWGDKLSIKMTDANGTDVYLAMSLYTQKGSIDDYATDFISYVQDMEEGYNYRIYPYVIENEGKNGKTYTNPGVSIKYSVDDLSEEKVNESSELAKLKSSYYKGQGDNRELVEGDIPPREFKQKAGKTVVDTDERDEYLYNILIGCSHVEDKRGSANSNQVTSATKEESPKTDKPTKPSKPSKPEKPAKPEATTTKKIEKDDLPF